MPDSSRPYSVLPLKVAPEGTLLGTGHFGDVKADQVYSDHMPQVGEFSLMGPRGLAKIRVLTYNVALSGGPLLFFKTESRKGNEGLIERTPEREWHRSQMIVNAIDKILIKQKGRAPIDCIILQEAPKMLSEQEEKGSSGRNMHYAFYQNLRERLGSDWEFILSATEGKVAIYNQAVLTLDSSDITIPEHLKHQVQSIRFHHEAANTSFVLHNVHFQWDDNQRVLENRLEQLLSATKGSVLRERVFFAGDFNGFLPPTEAEFQHTGTNTTPDLSYGATDGFFVWDGDAGRLGQLEGEVLDPKGGWVRKRPPVGVDTAREDDSYSRVLFEDNHRVKINGDVVTFSDLARGIQSGVTFFESQGAEHKNVCLKKNRYNRSKIQVSGVEYRLPFEEWGVESKCDMCSLSPDLAMDQAVLMYFYFLGLSSQDHLDAMRKIALRFKQNIGGVETGTSLHKKLVKFQGYVEKNPHAIALAAFSLASVYFSRKTDGSLATLKAFSEQVYGKPSTCWKTVRNLSLLLMVASGISIAVFCLGKGEESTSLPVVLSSLGAATAFLASIYSHCKSKPRGLYKVMNELVSAVENPAKTSSSLFSFSNSRTARDASGYVNLDNRNDNRV